MWSLLAGCVSFDSEASPAAFDWRIDRTRVPGILVTPLAGANGEARSVDALVLSPYDVEAVSVEICGLREDTPVVVGGACFSGDGHVEVLTLAGVPATVTLPELTYPCSPDGGCASEVPLRVLARTDVDEGEASVQVVASVGSPGPPGGGARWADLQLAVVEGVVEAGEAVALEASVPEEQPDGEVHWYVDDGELWSSGITSFYWANVNDGRMTSRNTLRIPEDWFGPLRAAVVSGDGTSWAMMTLEVP